MLVVLSLCAPAILLESEIKIKAAMIERIMGIAFIFIIEFAAGWYFAYRKAGVSIVFGDDCILYKNRKGEKRIRYDEICHIKIPIIRYTFFWVKIATAKITIRVFPDLKNFPGFVRELKTELEGRGLSDHYDRVSLFRCLKAVAYNDQSWERFTDISWKYGWVFVFYGIIGYVFADYRCLDVLDKILVTFLATFLLPVIPFLFAEPFFVWRIAKLSNEETLSVPARDTKYERKIYRRSFSIVTLGFLAMLFTIHVVNPPSPARLWGKYMENGKEAWHEERYDKAEKMFERALESAERISPQDESLPCSLLWLADTYERRKKYSDAEALLKRAVEFAEKNPDKKHVYLTEALRRLGYRCIDQQRYEEAEEVFKRALSLRRQYLDADDTDIIQSLYDLAHLYTKQERYEEAEISYLEVLTIQEDTLGPDHPCVGVTLKAYAEVLRGMGRTAEAEELNARAKLIGAEQTNEGDKEDQH
jgi:tetratricopeptide (TPR) repeat protein